jgi:hypothetical protein
MATPDPLCAAAAAFVTINFLRQNELICAAVATDRVPEAPSSADASVPLAVSIARYVGITRRQAYEGNAN